MFLKIEFSKLCIFFFRLKNFLHESSRVLDGNFLNLMYPVFVHMYVELLNNGHKTPGMYMIGQDGLIYCNIFNYLCTEPSLSAHYYLYMT